MIFRSTIQSNPTIGFVAVDKGLKDEMELQQLTSAIMWQQLSDTTGADDVANETRAMSTSSAPSEFMRRRTLLSSIFKQPALLSHLKANEKGFFRKERKKTKQGGPSFIFSPFPFPLRVRGCLQIHIRSRVTWACFLIISKNVSFE
jgi:hypothetical protein